MTYHEPVLLREAIEGLNIQPGGVYVDVTFGGGGHSKEILKRLEKEGRLVGFDQDPDVSGNVLADDRFTLVAKNFRLMQQELKSAGIDKVNGILADLGVSSHQFDTPERGFSLRFDSPLDMRMDRNQQRTAADITNEYSEKDLARIFRDYGELKNAGRIARQITSSRPFENSGILVKILERMAPRGKEHKFYAQIFQALRIEVNDELESLRELLEASGKLLVAGGRLVVISYHSLEDRMVKNFMKTGNFSGTAHKDFFGNLERPFKPINSKPIAPGDKEIEQNNRSRSARMRIAERLEDK